MANISSVTGTITLKGGWTQEDIDAFIPVLNCWSFYGEYGIQYYDETPTADNPRTGFGGCGRWSFSGTLESFDDWTRDWIKKPGNSRNALSQEQYDLLLKRMAERKLSIQIEFDDREEGVGFDLHETGELASNGQRLRYRTLSCEENVPDWKDFRRADFDDAAAYFLSLAPDANKDQIRKWVRLHVKPTSFFCRRYGPVSWIYFWESGGNCVEEEDMLDFRDTFSPQGDAWDEVVQSSEEDLEWDLTAQSEEAALFEDLAASGQANMQVNLRLKPTVIHNGSNGMLEDDMSLAVMSLANGMMMIGADELQNREGPETPIVGMIFRLDPEGNLSRAANDFDPNDCGGMAEDVAALEARFGGRCRFDRIFEINDDDGDDEQQLGDYFDFLQGALELLLGVKLRQEGTQTEETEVPHFLDGDGNEYFFGFMVFVVKNELSVSAVGPDGQELDLTEEQRGAVMRRALQFAQLEWTEEDQAWYDDWINAKERGWPMAEPAALDFTGKRFVLSGVFQHAPEDRNQIKALIEAKGGKCTQAVSGKTDYLVLGDQGNVGEAKVEQAQEQQSKGSPIQIIAESALFKFLN